MKRTARGAAAVMLALLPVFGLFGCGGHPGGYDNVRNDHHPAKARKPIKNKPTQSEKGGELWLINARSAVRTSI